MFLPTETQQCGNECYRIALSFIAITCWIQEFPRALALKCNARCNRAVGYERCEAKSLTGTLKVRYQIQLHVSILRLIPNAWTTGRIKHSQQTQLTFARILDTMHLALWQVNA